MEAVGLAFGTSGIITLAGLCLQIANVIEATQSFRSDLESLYQVYNFEHVRLRLWLALVLGIRPQQGEVRNLKPEDAEVPAVLGSASPIDLEAPLRGALHDVKRVLKEIEELLATYDATSNKRSGSRNSAVPSGKSNPSFRTLLKFQTKVYKEGGKERLKALLKELKDWNDRLDGLVGARLRGSIATNMRSQVIASADTDQQLQVVEAASRATHPLLSREATFKRGRMAADQSGALPQANLKLDVAMLRPSQPPSRRDGNSLRTLGWLTGASSGNIRVLQEWKFGQSDWETQEISTARDRVDKLARILHLDSKPEQLRCLDLVGYATKDSHESNRTRLDFCFLYQLPSFADRNSEPTTLLEALDFAEKDRPSLAERFHLAVVLAESLLCLHTHNWIHKAICSSNIIFFGDSQSRRLAYSKPFVAGFEFARPDTATDRTLDQYRGTGFEVFCHPDLRQTLQAGRSNRPRYQRQYDIYGLGIVLLEIGCWMPGAAYLEARAEDSTVSDHEHLMMVCDECVPSRMGSTYKDIVRACLTWRGDDERLAPGQGDTTEGTNQRRNQIEEFMFDVVDALRTCHCRL